MQSVSDGTQVEHGFNQALKIHYVSCSQLRWGWGGDGRENLGLSHGQGYSLYLFWTLSSLNLLGDGS